jgi:hypothetical protein
MIFRFVEMARKILHQDKLIMCKLVDKQLFPLLNANVILIDVYQLYNRDNIYKISVVLLTKPLNRFTSQQYFFSNRFKIISFKFKFKYMHPVYTRMTFQKKIS